MFFRKVLYQLRLNRNWGKKWNVKHIKRYLLYLQARMYYGEFLPIYWKFFGEVPAPEILAHRVIWSFIFVLFIVALLKTIKKLLSSSNETEKNMAWTFTFVSI